MSVSPESLLSSSGINSVRHSFVMGLSHAVIREPLKNDHLPYYEGLIFNSDFMQCLRSRILKSLFKVGHRSVSAPYQRRHRYGGFNHVRRGSSLLLQQHLQSVNRIFASAIKRGVEPDLRPLCLRNEYVTDAPRSGRPWNKTTEIEEVMRQAKAKSSVHTEAVKNRDRPDYRKPQAGA